MVSAQIAGMLRFYKKSPDGSMKYLYGNNTRQIGTGGSSEGAIAQTQEKWAYLPVQDSADKVLMPNDHLIVTFEAEAAGTSDATDGAVLIPLTLSGGAPLILGKFSDSAHWDVQQFGDVALLTQEIKIAERTIRERCVLGSNQIRAFASIEDNS